jgi:hypothetical protein
VQGSAQRFALPALGRAAGRRPTGKMLRRRKRLGIAPDSPASGARFVGRALIDKPIRLRAIKPQFFSYANNLIVQTEFGLFIRRRFVGFLRVG